MKLESDGHQFRLGWGGKVSDYIEAGHVLKDGWINVRALVIRPHRSPFKKKPEVGRYN